MRRILLSIIFHPISLVFLFFALISIPLGIFLFFIILYLGLSFQEKVEKQEEEKRIKEFNTQRKAEIEAYDKYLKFLKDVQKKHNITTNLNCIVEFNDTQIYCPKIEDYKLLFQQKDDITFSLHLYNRFHSRYGICKKNKIIKKISLKNIIYNSSFGFTLEQYFIKEQLENWESKSVAVGTQIIKDSIDYSNSNLICLKPNCIYKNQKYCCEKKWKENKNFSQNIIYEILKENWEYERTIQRNEF